MWLGSNSKMSIRRFLALCFSADFIINISHAIYNFPDTKSYSEVAMLLGLEAGLIAALLSLTTYTNTINQKKSE